MGYAVTDLRWTFLLVPVALCAFAGQAHSEEKAPSEVCNSIGMSFVSIPSGQGQVGSPNDEPGRADDETQRTVEFAQPFFLGQCEVTQQQFQQVMRTNPSAFSAQGGFHQRLSAKDTSNLPVDSVSWNDAVDFCKRLSELPAEQQAGRSYRLPTESEWEYAARAGSSASWHFGDDREQLHRYAWFGRAQSANRTHHVASKLPNRWGLYDMYGNVWEWCADARERSEHAAKDAPAPSRLIKGGSWYSRIANCRSATRRFDPAEVDDPDTGFRIVMELVNSEE